MIAIILAAGTATRLRPITKNLPKALLEVGGKKIIDRQIETLYHEGIKEIIVVTGYHAETLENYLKITHPFINFIFKRNAEYESSGAAYSLILALKQIKESAIYLNGDVIYDPKILNCIIKSSYKSTTAIQKIGWDEEQVNIILNRDNSIKLISKKIEKNNSDGEFIGVTKLSYSFIQKINNLVTLKGVETFRYNFAIDLLNEVNSSFDEKIFATDVTKFEAIEIDTESDLINANLRFKNEIIK